MSASASATLAAISAAATNYSNKGNKNNLLTEDVKPMISELRTPMKGVINNNNNNNLISNINCPSSLPASRNHNSTSSKVVTNISVGAKPQVNSNSSGSGGGGAGGGKFISNHNSGGIKSSSGVNSPMSHGGSHYMNSLPPPLPPPHLKMEPMDHKPDPSELACPYHNKLPHKRSPKSSGRYTQFYGLLDLHYE